MASKRAAARSRADETWQRLVDNRPGVEDLLEGKRLPVAAIDANPQQPRKGQLEGIEELAASIREYGLLQPIVVGPRPDGRYTCIAGHRRLAAYRYLGEHEEAEPSRWATIPAVERDDHSDEWVVLALLENLSRSDLTDAEIISGLSVLHDLRGWHQAEIARRLGVSRAWITQYFRVAADPSVSEHVQTRQLSAAKAYEIVRAGTDAARDAALRAALQGAPRQVVRRLARPEAAGGAPSDAPGAADAPPPIEVGGDAGAPGRSARDAARAPGWPGPSGDPPTDAPPGQGPPVATAAADAAVRDMAELAAARGVTGKLGDLQITRLIRSALEAGTDEFDAAAFLRLVRADVRHVEALVRTAVQRERGRAGVFSG